MNKSLSNNQILYNYCIFWMICNIGFSSIMAVVDEAIEKIENGTAADDVKDGILYKLLKVDKNIAIIMASDMIFAGVDTVSSHNLN